MLSGLCFAGLLAAACHLPQCWGDAVSKRTLMSAQGKTTMKMSEGGGCVRSASLHQACDAPWLVLLLVILAGLKLPQKLEGAATITPSLLGVKSWEYPEW